MTEVSALENLSADFPCQCYLCNKVANDFVNFRAETETLSVCVSFVCLSVASHSSETSEAIAITFDTVTASVMRMHHVSFFFTLSEVIQQ